MSFPHTPGLCNVEITTWEQSNKTGCRYYLKREVGGSSAALWAFIAGPWQTPTQSCSWLWDSQLVPTHPNLSVFLNPAGLGAEGNWSRAHAKSRGKRGGEPRMGMSCSAVNWWYKHRGLWPGRSRDQDIEVMDWRTPKLRHLSHSLLHIAHINQVTMLGVRIGVEEMRPKDLMTSVWGRLEKKAVRVANINAYLCSYTAAICEKIVRWGQPYLKILSMVLKHFLYLHFELNLKNIERRWNLKILTGSYHLLTQENFVHIWTLATAHALKSK